MENPVKKAVDFAGKTVVVTGAAQGAGAEIARRFAQAGAKVAITYNSNGQAAAKRVRELSEMGAEAEAFRLDLCELDMFDGVVEAIKRRFLGIDCLINNAGIYPHSSISGMTVKEWDEMFACNTRGTFFLSRSVAKLMIEQGKGGAMVNISSINATNPSEALTHYGASKAAVEQLTRNLAAAWGGHGIRVNCVAPGLIDRATLDMAVPGWRQSYEKRAPLRAVVPPEEIGNACIFLCSPLAGFITGQTLTVDGGVLLAPAFDWS
ncbi:MAG: SDR family NAD(P)-dependent oxidoreductase [Clostridia bacterium]|nr:SDR family NAD(P)-dependent oxidoreductase [Clostridia bacterium]